MTPFGFVPYVLQENFPYGKLGEKTFEKVIYENKKMNTNNVSLPICKQ